jgi:hypothetical protein
MIPEIIIDEKRYLIFNYQQKLKKSNLETICQSKLKNNMMTKLHFVSVLKHQILTQT